METSGPDCDTGPCHDECWTSGCYEPPTPDVSTPCVHDDECSGSLRCIDGACIEAPEGYCARTFDLETLPIGIASHGVHADVDGDGRRELVVLEDGSTLGTYFYDPEANAQVVVRTFLDEPLLIAQPVAADFDGDGRDELVAPAVDRLVLLRGDGMGGFAEAGAIQGIAFATAAGDFDSNGNVDLAIASSENLVYFGDGALGFEPVPELAFGSAGLGLVAGNLDGMPGDDLVFASEVLGAAFGATPTGWTEIASRGDGDFVLAFPHLADTNGDGRDEVLIVDPTRGVLALTGTPDNPLADLVVHPAPELQGTSVGAGDVVGEGTTDLVALGHEALILFPDGECWTRVPTNGSPNWVHVFDFDGDGRDDIAFSHDFDNQLTVLFGEAAG